MKRYMLTINTNWADEIDIDGCYVITEEQYNKFIQKSTELKEDSSFYMYIGTNEEIDCEWSEQANCFKVKEITDEEFKILKKLNLLNVGFASYFYESVCDECEEE